MFEIIKMTKANKQGTVKAYFTCSYEGLVITNCQIYETKDNKLGISLPQQKGVGDKYYSVVYFGKSDTEKMNALKELALEHYKDL